jgi:hypothetical protein
MTQLLHFGDRIDGYDVPVLNEREVRASAGILFLFAITAFLNAWLTGSFYLTRIFVIAFLIDFSIRIFVNPAYSPTMILGRFFVRHQQAEYVGAPQKRFAWSIGLLLAVSMAYLIVINNVIGPVNLFICLTCLLLLFFESAFGICIACKVYNLAFKEKAKLCPGNVCEVNGPKQSRKITPGQTAVTLLFMVAIVAVGKLLPGAGLTAVGASIDEPLQNATTAGDCKVPDWAVAIGHAEKWKLHNNCQTTGALPVVAGAVGSADKPTVEIIAMAHPPVQSALKPLREWLAQQGDKLRVVEIDAESAQGEHRLQAVGLKGHVPIAILIDGKYRYPWRDGATIEFINFPAAPGNPAGFSGTWAAEDVEALLSDRMK